MNKSILRKALAIQRKEENRIESDRILREIYFLKGLKFGLNELNQILKNIGTTGFVRNDGCSGIIEDYGLNGCAVSNDFEEYKIVWKEESGLYTITKAYKA